jgi:hypothetical protein
MAGGQIWPGNETIVTDQCSLTELLGQASVNEAGKVFRESVRGGVRMMLAEVMAAEVVELRGEK